MNYWLHRITGGDYALPLASALFNRERDAYLSIGWSDFSKDSFLDIIKTGEHEFNKMFMDWWEYYPRNRYNLWRFVNSMQPGDYVVVPFPYYFTVCEIADDKVYTNESIDESLLVDWNGAQLKKAPEDGVVRLHDADNNSVDLGFYRRVKIVVKDIPRNYANQDLYSRMKLRQTNAYISDIGSSVEEAMERFRDGKPIDLRASILESTEKEVLDIIHKLYTDDKFEDLVGRYLKAIGANRVETPAKNESPTEDGDADRIGYFDKLGVAVMVQAKKHTETTDSWAVEQIKAFKENHAMAETTLSWVISTCDDYSEEAHKLAQEANVRLINGREFVDMLLDAGLQAIAEKNNT